VVRFCYVILRSFDDISEVSLNDVRCCDVTRSLPNPAHGLSERIPLLAHLRSWIGEGLKGASCTGQGPYDDVLQDCLLQLPDVLSGVNMWTLQTNRRQEERQPISSEVIDLVAAKFATRLRKGS
jgi:hypothetical protein